ncbi:Phospholipid:diacylglycerol acyltransferase [Arachis hypogaea]|nr:Phospholipid:diacylglycerol acyltransferase [Arachis hypogaea]
MELSFRFHDGNCEVIQWLRQITTCSKYGDLLYIDTSAIGGDEDPFLKDGVYSANGDETDPLLSAGFICARDAAPANLLEGRGTQSGAHVDILGKFTLI